jgi:hypothetical protein
MVSITLDRLEVETGRLPAVCMRCGAPATGYVSEEFSGRPRRRLLLELSFGLLWFALLVGGAWACVYVSERSGVSSILLLLLLVLLWLALGRIIRDRLLQPGTPPRRLLLELSFGLLWAALFMGAVGVSHFASRWLGVSGTLLLLLLIVAWRPVQEAIRKKPPEADASMRRMKVAVPLCDAHETHFWWRREFMVLSCMLTVFVGGGALILAAVLVGTTLHEDPSGLLCGGGSVLFALLMIPCVVLVSTAIRATEVTDSSITLAGVSPKFVEAVEGARAPRPNGHSRTGPASPEQPSAGSGDPATPPPGGSPPDSQPQRRD